jgi:hypothetical protein
MRFQARSASSAVLVALCTLLMGGCGGGTVSEEGGAGAEHSGDELEASTSNGGTTENTGTTEDTGTTESTGTTEEAEGGGEGVTICHIPPGNPANAHTLTVGEPAVKAHLRHGDTLGSCGGSQEPTPDAGTPPTESDAGTTTPDAGTTTPDAGTTDPGPTCGGLNAACGSGTACCAGLMCLSNVCTRIIN